MSLEVASDIRCKAETQSKEGRAHLDRGKTKEPKANHSTIERQNHDPASLTNFEDSARFLAARQTASATDAGKVEPESS